MEGPGVVLEGLKLVVDTIRDFGPWSLLLVVRWLWDKLEAERARNVALLRERVDDEKTRTQFMLTLTKESTRMLSDIIQRDRR